MLKIGRFSLLFFLILLTFIIIYAIFSSPLVCKDPAGCIWIGPDDPLDLGVSVITTGGDRPVSVEIKQAMELFSLNFEKQLPDHPIQIQTYFSACLPNVPDQSAVGLSADNHILAVIGPICAEDTADFTQRMVNTNKFVISPIPYRSHPKEVEITLYPDLYQLADQAAALVQSMGFSRIIITHDIDDQSSALSVKLCEIFKTNGTCLVNPDGPTGFDLNQFDASVQVFLDESNPPDPGLNLSGDVLPRIIISFSRPTVIAEQIRSYYWIGPRIWNKNKDFSKAYFATYNNYPSSFAAWLIYDRLPMIYNVIKETAVTAWDGSWIIPQNILKQHLKLEFLKDDIFCLAASNECSKLPFDLYQVSGNEYKLHKP